MEFKDKVVLITGGASGIGAATTQKFSAAGAKVIIADIEQEKAITMISELGSNVSFVHTDVSSYSNVVASIKETVQAYGQLDIIVCNAGVGNKTLNKTAEHSLEEWDRVLSINQSGVFYCMKAALSQMMLQGHGNIVNVASVAGLKASGNNIAYSASKFAVVGMTKSAALEYASKNIRINCVCPGYTRTPLLQDVFDVKPDYEGKLVKFIPMKRYGKAEEIAEAILWLASEKSAYINGQHLVIDGGISI